MRVCSVPGCPEIYPGNRSRCPTHRREGDKQRASHGVYNTAGHARFRRAVLTRDPICTNCGKAIATVADHYPHTRQDLITLGLNPNDPDHGRGLCKPCHDKHTAQTTPGGFRAG